MNTIYRLIFAFIEISAWTIVIGLSIAFVDQALERGSVVFWQPPILAIMKDWAPVVYGAAWMIAILTYRYRQNHHDH